MSKRTYNPPPEPPSYSAVTILAADEKTQIGFISQADLLKRPSPVKLQHAPIFAPKEADFPEFHERKKKGRGRE